jgi:transposase
MERKVKYDYAFKLENAKLVLEKCYSCNYGWKGIERSNLANGLGFISIMEPIGLLSRKNQSYSVAFKFERIALNCQRFIERSA